MTDPFAKVRPGQSMAIPAAAWNGFIDTRNWVESRKLDRGEAPLPVSTNSTIVMVKNASGGTVGRFGVLGVDSPIIAAGDKLSSFQSRVALSCSTPAAGHKGRFVVLLEPLTDGKFGRAVVSGAVQVLLDVVEEEDAWAEIDDGESGKLKTAVFGSARILCKESGTGEKWGIVLLGSGTGFCHAGVAKADGGIAARSGSTPGSAECDLYRLDDDDLVDTGRTAIIKNMSGKAVTAGAWIQYKSDAAGVLWVDVEACEEEE